MRIGLSAVANLPSRISIWEAPAAALDDKVAASKAQYNAAL